jgi:hypothetical protein
MKGKASMLVEETVHTCHVPVQTITTLVEAVVWRAARSAVSLFKESRPSCIVRVELSTELITQPTPGKECTVLDIKLISTRSPTTIN